MKKQMKIKIFELYIDKILIDDGYEIESIKRLLANGTSDWMYVNEDKLFSLNEAVAFMNGENNRKKIPKRYLIVRDVNCEEDGPQIILDQFKESVDKYKEEQETKNKKIQQQLKREQEKRDKANKERDLKKLKQLQKQYGEQK